MPDRLHEAAALRAAHTSRPCGHEASRGGAERGRHWAQVHAGGVRHAQTRAGLVAGAGRPRGASLYARPLGYLRRERGGMRT